MLGLLIHSLVEGPKIKSCEWWSDERNVYHSTCICIIDPTICPKVILVAYIALQLEEST